MDGSLENIGQLILLADRLTCRINLQVGQYRGKNKEKEKE